MKTIIILGGSGLLGQDLTKILSQKFTVFSYNSKEASINDFIMIKELFTEKKPDIVINSAAITNVDWAELHKEETLDINSYSVKNLARLSNEMNFELYHISTDYVFNGMKDTKYNEKDNRSSVNFYGYTKILAEEFVETICDHYKILRVAWLFGRGRKTLLNKILESKGESLGIINDQWGDPTYTGWVARIMEEMIIKGLPDGIYNLTSSAGITRYEFAKILNNRYNLNINLKPISSSELQRTALRPRYTSLTNKKLANLLNRDLEPFEIQLNMYDDE